MRIQLLSHLKVEFFKACYHKQKMLLMGDMYIDLRSNTFKGGGHAKIIFIIFISIDSLGDILYNVYAYFLKNYDIVVKFGIEKSIF